MNVKHKQIRPGSKHNRVNYVRFVPPAGGVTKWDICRRLVNTGGFNALNPADADNFPDVVGQLWLAVTGATRDGTQPKGMAVTRGTITGQDTSGGSLLDPVYLSNTAGGWSLTAGTFKRIVGFISKVDATDGEIEFDGNYSAATILSGTATIANAAQTATVTIGDATFAGAPVFADIQGEAPLASPPVADSAATTINRVFWDASNDLVIEANAAANHATGVLVSWAIIP